LLALQKEGKDVRTCAKEAEECANLRYTYYNCKRGKMDARTRIAGTKG
jgi:hypothetical protein